MVGVETPRSWAVRFIDRPLTYSSTAATFRASGLPRGGVSVKFSPQPLHTERCLVRISPFLTCSSPPHRLQRSPMTNLLMILWVMKIGHLCDAETLIERHQKRFTNTVGRVDTIFGRN